MAARRPGRPRRSGNAEPATMHLFRCKIAQGYFFRRSVLQGMVLSGWKEIAQYLHCGVRTVQRWQGNGLPIHRPSPYRRSHVIAHSEELDRWIRSGSGVRSECPNLRASLATSRQLQLENRARVTELRERVIQLREAMQELRAHRTRNLVAGYVASPTETRELTS